MADTPQKTKSIFQGKFTLSRLLGKGGFGEVYAGVQTSNGESVAVKLERNNGKSSFLFHEARVMQEIQKVRTQDGIAGIATLKYFGQEGDYRMLIMSLQGPALEDMHEKLGRFSLKTTALLADQMISRLEYIHSVGYVHRDLKTENFLLGSGCNSQRIYLIDFGLSSRYLTTDGTHREMATGKCFLGTSRFASLRTHQGFSQSRRDDMEQLVYIMIYMYVGWLPWSGLNIRDHVAKEKRIGQLKAQLRLDDICAKCPRQFEDFLFYARNMDFAEAPQYDMCRALLRSILDELSPADRADNYFDWDPKATKNKNDSLNKEIVPSTPNKETKIQEGADTAPNILSSNNAKTPAMFSGFGSSNSPNKIVSINGRDE